MSWKDKEYEKKKAVFQLVRQKKSFFNHQLINQSTNGILVHSSILIFLIISIVQQLNTNR